jgi:hypothetical protein
MVTRMDNDERVTLRMGTEELQALDSFLAKNPKLGTRSQFIRTAISEYIDRDADVATRSDSDGIFTRFTESEMMAIKVVVEGKGMFISNEELIRAAVHKMMARHEETVENALSAAFEVASSQSMTK